jgi:formamidase
MDPPGSSVHPITGPVFIEGARAGDVIAVTLIDAKPGPYGYTRISRGGFLSDLFQEDQQIYWNQGKDYAYSKDLP